MRFDGVRFVPATLPSGKPVASASVKALLGAKDGSLWIGTPQGLTHWKNGADLVTYTDPPGGITSILEDSRGIIWVTRYRIRDTKGSLCRVEGSQLHCYGAPDGIPFGYATRVAEDSLGNLWIGSDAICRWKPGGASTIYFEQELRDSSGIAGVRAVVAGAGGLIWAALQGSGKSLGLQQFANGVWKGYVTPGTNGPAMDVSTLMLDRDGALWIGTLNRGIYRAHDGEADHFGSADGLSSDSVGAGGIFQDREGNVWIVTAKGIDEFRDFRIVSLSTREGLTSDEVNSVLWARDGTMWVGTEGALESFRNNKVSTIRTHRGLPGQTVTTLFEDHAGKIWLGIDNDLAVYAGGKFIKIRGAEAGSLGIITSITEDAENNIWAIAVTQSSPPQRLVCIRDMKVVEETGPPQTPPPVSIARDPQSGVWVGYATGDLARIREGKTEVFHLEYRPEGGRIDQLYVDSDGSALGETPSGLLGWRDGRAQLLTTKNGLPCDRIFTFIVDRHGNLWLYSACGLIAITNEDLNHWWAHPDALLRPKVLDVLDGAQPSLNSWQPASSLGPDGHLWFVGDVLQTIDPDTLSFSSPPPPVHIEGIIADRINYPPTDAVRLPSLTRELEIDYTGLSFGVPQKMRFRYRLQGRDIDWQEPGTRRQAFYSDLRPGHYRFHVTACNNDGVWNEQGATLDFVVLPAWYQTTRFLVLCLLTTIFTCWALYRLRVRQVARTISARFDERLAERTRLAREIHDTLVQTIQGSKMVADDALDEATDFPRMRQAMERLSVWLGQATEEGRAALNSLRTSTTQTNDLAASFRRALNECRIQGFPDTVFVEDGKATEMHPIVRDEIYRIGYEAIRNACQHSEATRIEVHLSYSRDLTLRIADNGKGIGPAVIAQGKEGHYGLQGMRERAVRISGKLSLKTSAYSGTVIELIVPGRIVFRGPRSVWSTRMKDIFRGPDGSNDVG
jgi:signal transduction histidine kinase/ligand-binding sensor domain-containing protein